MEYCLQLAMTESLDLNFDLPNEELASPAVYPRTHSLKLEYFQGYPQIINIEPFSNYPGAYVTVEDVLRAIHEDLKLPLLKREAINFARTEQAAIRAAFNERCKTEEVLSKGPRRIDCLCGRDKLQIVPRHPVDGAWLPSPTLLPEGFS